MHLCTFIIMLCFTCFVVMTNSSASRVTRKNFGGSTNFQDTTWDDGKMNKSPISCKDNFTKEIQHCVRPFSRNANLYITTRPRNPYVYQIFVKHVCRKYKKMLFCVHTALTNCPTVAYMQIVQKSLSKVWVTDVNKLCNIQSNSSSRNANKSRGNRKDVGDRTSIVPKTLSKSKSRISEMFGTTAFNAYPEKNQQSNLRNSKNKYDHDDEQMLQKLSDSKTKFKSSEDSDNSETADNLSNIESQKPDIVISLYKPEYKGQKQDLGMTISTNHKKYSYYINSKELAKYKPRLLKWLFIVIKSDSVDNTIQVKFTTSLENQSNSANLPALKTKNVGSSANCVSYNYLLFSCCTIILIILMSMF